MFVTLRHNDGTTVTVEASSIEEAREKAMTKKYGPTPAYIGPVRVEKWTGYGLDLLDVTDDEPVKSTVPRSVHNRYVPRN